MALTLHIQHIYCTMHTCIQHYICTYVQPQNKHTCNPLLWGSARICSTGGPPPWLVGSTPRQGQQVAEMTLKQKIGYLFGKKLKILGFLLYEIETIELLMRKIWKFGVFIEEFTQLLGKSSKSSGQLASIRDYIVNRTHYSSPTKPEYFPKGGGTAFPDKGAMDPLSPLSDTPDTVPSLTMLWSFIYSKNNFHLS